LFTAGASPPKREQTARSTSAAKGRPAARRVEDDDEEDEIDDREDFDDQDEEEPVRPRRKSAAKGASSSRALWIIGSVVAVLIVAGAGVGLAFAIKHGLTKEEDAGQQQAQAKEPESNPQPDPGGNASATDRFKPATNPTPSQPSSEPGATGSQSSPNSTILNPPLPGKIIVDSAPREPVVPVAPPVSGKISEAAKAKVKNATVFLKVKEADGTEVSGSGFFGMEKDVVITNAHVVGMLARESRPPKQVDIVLNSGLDNEVVMRGKVLAVDRISDLAVLKAESLKAEPTVIPAPLEVKSAEKLTELQEVYTFGFPFGEMVGKEVTIRPSAIASFRKKSGTLQHMQIHGGIDPGNSGGPVVDANGDVVGVAVAVFSLEHQIALAVPGNRVQDMFRGRIANVVVGQAYEQGAKTIIPVSVEMMDPLKKVKQVAVEAWCGAPKPGTRPAAVEKAPKPLEGDSPHVATRLEYSNGEAHGEIVLPALTAGQEYWFQPTFIDGDNRAQWAQASVQILKSPPVKKDSADLVLHQRRANRSLVLDSTMTLTDPLGSREMVVKINTQARIQEKVTSQNNNVVLEYRFSSLKLGMTINDQPPPASVKKEFERIENLITKVYARTVQDRDGNTDPQPPNVERVPKDDQALMQAVLGQIQDSLEALTFPLPNERASAGKSWQGRRNLEIGTVSRFEQGAMDMTYTFQGVRRREGREEAVIALEGVLKGRPGIEEKMGGKAHGAAVFDLAAGQITSAEATISVDATVKIPIESKEPSDPKDSKDGKETPHFKEAKVFGSLNVKLQRDLH
jgi:S1-C subfamily serine protease